MDMSLHQTLHRTVIRLLRPLVRVLINHGVSYGAFSEAARQAFVEEGYAHMQRGGQRPTASGVSALTGLNRKEVKRINEQEPGELTAAESRRNRAIRVLTGWTTDADFMTDGGPKVLPVDGDSHSFNALVRRYSGDVTPAAMLSLLAEAGSVAREGANVRLLRNAYLPMATPVERLNILGGDSAELIETIAHNIRCTPEERRFQRKVSTPRLKAEHVAEFEQLVNQRSQELLEEYDQWLSQREFTDEHNSPSDARYVAVGIYFYQDTNEEVSS